MDLEQSGACEGQFEEDYRPLRSIGKGAFGFVWLASRRIDGQEVSDTLSALTVVHTLIFILLRDNNLIMLTSVVQTLDRVLKRGCLHTGWTLQQ